MSTNDYPACINELYLSEVLGEQAFVHWIEKELAGEEGSLDAALIQLQHPLPVP